MRSLALIIPPLLVLRKDPMTTGIVYMPVGAAVLAAQVRRAGHVVEVIDAFGAAPDRAFLKGKFLYRGLGTGECANMVKAGTDAVAVYALSLMSHDAILGILTSIRRRFPYLPIAVIENSQAVTAYSLASVSAELYKAGADALLLGEADLKLTQWLEEPWSDAKEAPELKPVLDTVNLPDMEDIPFPLWNAFPLEGYWSLRHSHGPRSAKRYLAIQTSRGCPYHCKFCVAPAMNQGRWRARPAEAIVEEIAWAAKSFGVHEFHWEDLNPTIDDGRIRAICEGLTKAGRRVTWKIAAGTKVESLRDEETISLMSRAGCTYLSISPETGSSRILELMGKPFDLQHARNIVRLAKKHAIRVQCCFVLGFFGETDEDRALTADMIDELTRIGVDEIAIFIMTPAPGSRAYADIHPEISTLPASLSEFNFSPTWRSDYAGLAGFRNFLYRRFVIKKCQYQPMEVLRQCFNFARGVFETKMEMAPMRALCHWATMWRADSGDNYEK